ncbi:MAG: hypothetical protein WCI71_16800, partial [Bacteroidota bacterium]
MVTLTMNEACNDIHLAVGTTAQGYGRVATVTYTLEINGKMRGYVYNTVIPGTSTGTITNPPFTKSAAGSSGLVRIVGNSRNVTNTGEFGSFSATAPTTNASIEIAMNSGQTATFQTAGKFASWDITSGTLDFTGRLSVDLGTTTLGNVTVSAGATLISKQSGTIMSRTSTGVGGVFNMAGTLILTRPSVSIGMTTVNFTGTVKYDTIGVQTLLTSITGGGLPNNYNNLILAGSGVKTLGLNTNVNGTLTLTGTATLALSTFTLTYGGSSTLTYAGSSAQTTTATELPSAGGPNSLTINNSNGVILGGSVNVPGVLSLTSGLLTLGSNDLTLGTASTIAGTPSSVSMVVATGTGQLRKGFGAAGSFLFPVGDNTVTPEYSPVTLNFASGTFGTGNYAGINLVKAKYPGDPNTISYLSRYWNISQTGITDFSCNAMFQYLLSDVTGTESQIYCMKVNPAPFVVYDIANTTDHRLTASGLTTFSTFTGSMEAAAPTTQASNIVFTSVGETGMTADWTNGNGGKRVVIINTTNIFIDPVDGTDPIANSVYGGSGQQVVYNGAGSSVAVTGLTPSTTYWFYVYEYNGSGATTKYNRSTANDNPKSQATIAPALIPTVTTPTFVTITNTTAILGGDITGDGGAVILERGTVWKTTTGVAITDHKLAEGGTATGLFSHERTTLPAKTQIFFKAYATNSAGPGLSPETSFFTLADEPTTHVTGFAATGTGPVSINLTWTTAATGADGYLILRKDG